MINNIMKKNSENAYLKDLDRLDLNKLDNNITTIKNISYLDDGLEEHKLDIYYKDNSEKKPIIIDIHGGGFISSYKEMDSLFTNYLAQRGFIVFNLNYRLAYPKYNVFDQIDDISNALKWIINNAKKYDGDTENIYIVGHSAGGVLALAEALLCNDKQMRDDYNIDDRKYNYKGIILDCSAIHFYKNNIAYWGMRNMIFPKGYKKMNKYKYLVFGDNQNLSSLPKIVLLTNEKDQLRKMSYYFKDILDRKNIDNKLISIGNDGHMGIIFKTYTNENQQVLDDIEEYLGTNHNPKKIIK